MIIKIYVFDQIINEHKIDVSQIFMCLLTFEQQIQTKSNKIKKLHFNHFSFNNNF